MMVAPACHHLIAPLHFSKEVRWAIAVAASLPHQRMGSLGPPVPRAARTNRGEPKLLPATGDLHTLVCGLVRRLRHARAGGGPHVPKDSSPHLVTPQRPTAVRANPAAGAAGPMSHLQHDDRVAPR